MKLEGLIIRDMEHAWLTVVSTLLSLNSCFVQSPEGHIHRHILYILTINKEGFYQNNCLGYQST